MPLLINAGGIGLGLRLKTMDVGGAFKTLLYLHRFKSGSAFGLLS
ncbi:hypothetical protein [Acanthopleuribacter pedis]|nr:hypothetical protein [Acanthopleuribacter pedis]